MPEIADDVNCHATPLEFVPIGPEGLYWAYTSFIVEPEFPELDAEVRKSIHIIRRIQKIISIVWVILSRIETRAC